MGSVSDIGFGDAYRHNTTNDADSDDAPLRWEAYVTLVVIGVVVVILVSDAVPPTSAIVGSAAALYTCGIIDVDDLFKGLVNTGVLAIAFMLIIVDPVTKLPLIQRLVDATLSAESLVLPAAILGRGRDDDAGASNATTAAGGALNGSSPGRGRRRAALDVTTDGANDDGKAVEMMADGLSPPQITIDGDAAPSTPPRGGPQQQDDDGGDVQDREHMEPLVSPRPARRASLYSPAVGPTVTIRPEFDTAAPADPQRSSTSSDQHRRTRWPLAKLVLLSLALSPFLENTPHVAAFAPMVTKHCIDHGVAPSRLLLPMAFAVILGNYGVVGCGSNLVFSSLLEEDGYGRLSFFELAKVGLPQLPFVMAYLVFAPMLFLTRSDSRSIAGAAGAAVAPADRTKTYRMTCGVAPGSRAIGMSVGQLATSVDFTRRSVRIVGACNVHEALTEENCDLTDAELATLRISERDRLVVEGTPAAVQELCDVGQYALQLLTLNGFPARRQAVQWALADRGRDDVEDVIAMAQSTAATAAAAAQLPHYVADGATGVLMAVPAQAPSSSPGRKEGAEEGATDANAPIAADERYVAASLGLHLVEVVLSARNASIGRTISSQHFQHRYDAAVVAVRPAATSDHDDSSLHVWAVGDVAVVLCPSTFEQTHQRGSYEFVSMVALTKADADIEAMTSYVLTFPGWVPFGIPSGFEAVDKHAPVAAPSSSPPLSASARNARRPKRRLVVLPPAYGYISILILVAVLVGAAFELPLSAISFGGAILTVASGLTTTSKALHVINLDVYIMIAFSFALGEAVDNSGLARAIGAAIVDADITGFPLMLLVCVVSVLLANLITNKAASQVMYPIIIEVYRARELDPVPAVIAAAYSVVIALCLPYAMPASVLVLAPGGYRTGDFMKFGLPLTVMSVLLTTLTVMIVYEVPW